MPRHTKFADPNENPYEYRGYDDERRASEAESDGRRSNLSGGRSTSAGGGTTRTTATTGYPMSRADDSDADLGQTITGATFRHALDGTEKPTARGRHNKMWRKARQQKKLEDDILNSTARYRERTYGEGGDQSSGDEPPPAAYASPEREPADTGADTSGYDTDTRSVNSKQTAKEKRNRRKREEQESKRTRKLTHLVLKETLEVKKETLHSIQKTQQYVAQAEDAGHSAARSLQHQNDQLRAIDDELEGLTPMIEIAKKDIKSIARRMARDKCFLALCCLVCVALIITIIMVVRNYILGTDRTIGGVLETVAPTLPPDMKAFRTN